MWKKENRRDKTVDSPGWDVGQWRGRIVCEAQKSVWFFVTFYWKFWHGSIVTCCQCVWVCVYGGQASVLNLEHWGLFPVSRHFSLAMTHSPLLQLHNTPVHDEDNLSQPILSLPHPPHSFVKCCVWVHIQLQEKVQPQKKKKKDLCCQVC